MKIEAKLKATLEGSAGTLVSLCAHGPPQPILTLFIFSTVFVEVSLAFVFIAFLPYQTVRFVRARTYL